MNKDWLDITVLEDYLDGKLDSKEMNRVEREALQDPFVAEALEGLSLSPSRSREALSMLQKQLQQRIAEEQLGKRSRVITWQRLSIAAAAAVVFISAGIIFWMKQVNYQEQLAKQPKKVDVEIAARPELSVAAGVGEQFAATDTADADQDLQASPAKKAVIKVTKEDQVAVVDRKAEARTEKAVQEHPPRAAVTLSASRLSAFSDVQIVSGTVIDANTRLPLANTHIYSNAGAPKSLGSTDENGTFQLEVDTTVKTLMLSNAGYDNLIAKITPNEPLNVALNETNQSVNETVIRGYQKRISSAPGIASSIVSGREVKDVPVANVEQLLQGKVAGLNIKNISGEPTAPKAATHFTLNSKNINAAVIMTVSGKTVHPIAAASGATRPLIGWPKFIAYLNENNRYAGDAQPGEPAEFSFQIKDKRPKDFTVIKGFSDRFDEEVRRLISNGPNWNLQDKKLSRIVLRIEY